MTLLSKPVFAAGGGGTTFCETLPVLPLSRRRRSRAESADGGGAMTAGAGRLSFALRELSRSGAETGGGTTALLICTRDGETSWLTEVGAGGITLPVSAGVGSERSCETCVDGGAITLELSEGALRERSRETLGAGAMMLAFSAGAVSVCSDCTVGVGGTTAALSAGELRA